MRNSLLISLCLLLASCATTQNNATVGLSESPLFDTTGVSKYRVLIKTGQAEITGILVLKYIDNEWRGSLINEFGIKAFDFIAPQGKCKLQNTISFLDKWYIRKTVEGDFAFLFWDATQGKTVKGKSLQRLSDEGWLLKNEKRKIEYLLQKINTTSENYGR